MAHMDYGRRLLDQMVRDLEDIALVEQMPSMEGRSLGLLLAPSRKKAAAIAKDRAEGAAEAAAHAPAPTAAPAPKPIDAPVQAIDA